jgi:hypothetical protein
LEHFTVYEHHVSVSDYNVLKTNFTGMYNNIGTLQVVYVRVSVS